MMNHCTYRFIARSITSRFGYHQSTAVALFGTSRNDNDDKRTRNNIQDSIPAGGNDEESKEWIPPNRPLSGDKGQPVETPARRNIDAPDWMATRRAKQQQQQTLHMDLPNKNRKFQDAELEVLEGVLLSSNEIQQCLNNMGALDISELSNGTKERLNVDSMILCTATSRQHLQLISDTLVRQLKIRKLASLGVVGASLGAEISDDWSAIDCRNHYVHIMLRETRKHLDLEGLWSGNDPSRKIRYNDEDAVDDYVASYPIPEEYGRTPDDMQDVSGAVSQLQRWNIEHKAVVPNTRKKRRGMRRKTDDPRLI